MKGGRMVRFGSGNEVETKGEGGGLSGRKVHVGDVVNASWSNATFECAQ
jgi:hypothetical protein